MTYEEALEIIRQHEIAITRSTSKNTLTLALCVAEKALKKQIPIIPLENEQMWAVCPNCGGSISKDNVQEHIFNGDTTFCEHCGQALDWSEEG